MRGLWALAAGACGGFAFVTKPTAAILCPAFALYALWLLRSGGRSWVSGLRSLAASLGPLVVAGGFVLAFNYYRFGSMLDLGYGDEPATGFTTPLLTGVALLLTSSGKGLLWFCPAVVAGLWGWRAFARAHPVPAALAALLLVSQLAFFGRWWAWYGGWCWGPRFLLICGAVPHVGLAATLATRAPQTAFLPRGARGRLIGLVTGVGVNALGVLIDYS